jgi:hypothetical protein
MEKKCRGRPVAATWRKEKGGGATEEKGVAPDR